MPYALPSSSISSDQSEATSYGAYGQGGGYGAGSYEASGGYKDSSNSYGSGY